MSNHIKHTYENNPFFIGLNGIKLLFAKAQSVAIFAIILCVLGFVANTAANIIDVVSNTESSPYSGHELNKIEQDIQTTPQDLAPAIGLIITVAAIVGVILLVIILISIWVYGSFEYTGARLAADKQVDWKEALVQSGKRLPGYIWLNIIMIVKILLWSLLFIVPGFIMAIRYSLSGTVFFAEGKKGNAAIKRSLELTKGAWFTTFAAYGLWNFITFNQVTALLQPGTSAVLYRQLRDVTDHNKPKPAAHWLSWMTLLVPIVFVLMIISFIAVIAGIIAIAAYGH